MVNCTIDDGCSNLYDSLAKRVKIANDNNIDLFCSLHCNAFNGNAYGTETYLVNRSSFSSEESYKKNYGIAQRVQEKVSNSCGFYSIGVKHEEFYVIYNTKALAVLVEICFCDNKDDYNKFNAEKVVTAICEDLTNEDYNTIEIPSVKPITSELYRVRKSCNDAATQIGAYSILENAKKECDSRSGYNVFDRKGNKVYPVVVVTPSIVTKPQATQNEYIIKEYKELGVFTCTVDSIYFRNKLIISNDNPTQGYYSKGEKVNYDHVVITNKYVCISWISASSGVRRYMPY